MSAAVARWQWNGQWRVLDGLESEVEEGLMTGWGARESESPPPTKKEKEYSEASRFAQNLHIISFCILHVGYSRGCHVMNLVYYTMSLHPIGTTSAIDFDMKCKAASRIRYPHFIHIWATLNTLKLVSWWCHKSQILHSFVFAVRHQFPGRPEVLEHDVPLLVHGGPLELCVGLVEPVPKVEPPEASVEPGRTGKKCYTACWILISGHGPVFVFPSSGMENNPFAVNFCFAMMPKNVPINYQSHFHQLYLHAPSVPSGSVFLRKSASSLVHGMPCIAPFALGT